eukprot:CCRYP_015568-RA/>CCRYP_015568-RA protein AED:0.48 eAED:0.48 QI:0/-1/0/1/-1/1/1/0/73
MEKKDDRRQKGKRNQQCGNFWDDSNDDDDIDVDGTMQEGMESSIDPFKEALINDKIDMGDGMAAVASDAAISN